MATDNFSTEQADVKERPMIFNGPMVQAILEGRKTQTRRPVKGLTQPPGGFLDTYVSFKDGIGRYWYLADDGSPIGQEFTCPYGKPGDRLWVRETWYYTGGNNVEPSPGFVSYRADGEFTVYHQACGYKWRPSIHMPRWASRIPLEITGVRIERLQEISYKDCCLETGAPISYNGIGQEPYKRDMQTVFVNLWDSIYGNSYPWHSNPWVWVIEFRIVQ